MKREMKSIALFDDGSRVSNYIKLYFQRGSCFTVNRVYSREELEHKMKKTPFDIIICPASSPIQAYSPGKKGNRICLYWSIVETPGKTKCPLHHLSFLFEIETTDAALSYNSSTDESLQEQFDTLSRLLGRIEKYHQDFIRFQADTEMLQSIVEDSATGIMHLLNNKIRWMNHESLRILGRTEHELIGKEFSSLFDGEDQYREVIRSVSRNRDSGGWGTAPCSLVRKTGKLVECTIRMRRLNPMNSQKGHLVFIENNADKKRLEWALVEYQERLAENEVKFLDALQKMNLIIIRTDLNGVISFWNDRAGASFGYPAGEVTGKNLVEIIADPESRTAKDMFVLLYDSGSPQENSALYVFENTKRNGVHLDIAWNILVFRDSGGTPAGIVWVGQDISDVDPKGTIQTRQESWKHQILKGTDVQEGVFDLLFHTAIELGRGGRESRKIGTSFIIGDAEKVMAQSRQCAINPYDGKKREQRMVQTKGNIENIKNLSLLDGAFVIDGSGFIYASSRHLLADSIDIDLPEGYGTRHASVAAMTRCTQSVGIVVSESGGTVTIFRSGKIAKQIIT
jgi:diadenylate cyclase